MDWPELIILDVGHGNCAILRDTDGTTIIDCPSGPTLIATLRKLAIKEITNIILSHADYDHISGVTNLILNPDVTIRNVFLNADTLRRTDTWNDLRSALKVARKHTGTKVHIGLTTAQTEQLNSGQVTIEVLAPTPELAMSGAGGEDLQGNKLSANSMSVVLGLSHNSHRIALLTGDIDEVGLKNLMEDCENLNADILVFPHHGGKAGSSDGENFATSLCNAVQPKMIIFSIDRYHFGNPRESVIRGIKAIAPSAHIMCTQLSRRCAAQLPTSTVTHLSALPAKGRTSNSCCGGSISIMINGKKIFTTPLLGLHREFVTNKVPTPMCLQVLAAQNISQ